MNGRDLQRLAPLLWIGGGVMFFLAAALGKQVAFVGVGAMFVLLGVAGMIRARKADES